MAAAQPPHGNEAYAKNAMAPPGVTVDNIEPWADLLDELDPRELAMGRFRTRHEIMAEIFGPEPVSECHEEQGASPAPGVAMVLHRSGPRPAPVTAAVSRLRASSPARPDIHTC